MPITTLALHPPASVGVEWEVDKPLAPLTSIKIGGPADYFVTVSHPHQLLRLARWARTVELPYLILGGGSNVLISDAGVRGLVIHNRCRTVRIDPAPCSLFPLDERPFLFAESGALLAGAARTSINEGLAGLEWAVSVPGTVGGAVINNAGAHGGEVKESLWDVMLLDEADEVRIVQASELDHRYRHSNLKRGEIIQGGFGPVVLSANFRLGFGDGEALRAKAQGFLDHRRRTQPVEPSLGSTFTNPAGDYAGRLIDAAGLRGMQIGGIEVSRTHANFLINPGGVGSGRAADVLALMEMIQERVLRQFGIRLDAEIQRVGAWQ
ncbi:MAG: UDP-N-acetylmuramate dehydrogenase [Caldilineaceae bacterium]|nr:UDP-N-acetylmuramate dehydrogenase [Caldilineaceae bacterium]HRJ40376.1 UDP-N-acetylmuramate dehydrogenase [Caldilineaceae bacterium]